jgi:uncharacterized protein (DUF1697 family)
MMTTCIALLRGINVLGKNMIKMDVLKKIFEDLNFRNVRTYIQSGNVVFQVDLSDVEQIEKKIMLGITSVTGHEVQVLVLAQNELGEIISNNPFSGDDAKDPAFLHITFLKTEFKQDKFREMEAKKEGNEEFRIIGKAVYLFLPHGYGRTKLNNSLFESKLKVQATTRNWRTVLELARMAEIE